MTPFFFRTKFVELEIILKRRNLEICEHSSSVLIIDKIVF